MHRIVYHASDVRAQDFCEHCALSVLCSDLLPAEVLLSSILAQEMSEPGLSSSCATRVYVVVNLFA